MELDYITSGSQVSTSLPNLRLSALAIRTVVDQSRANCVPETCSDQAQVDTFIEDAQSDLACYDQELLRAQTSLSRLEQERHGLHHVVELARSLASPVRRLPPEILLEIFSFRCLSSTASSLSITEEKGDRKCPTLDISQTCAFWRAVAFSQPSLWASINVDLNCITGCNATHLVSHYFRASRSSPVCLRVSVDANMTLNAHALEVVDLLLDESARWQEASVCGTTHFMKHAASRLSSRISSSATFPLLERLECDSLTWQDGDEELYSCDLFLSSPKLKTCDVTTIRPWAMDSIALHSLTTLNLDHYFDGFRLTTLLSFLPMLSTCNIQNLWKTKLPEPVVDDIPSHFDLRELTLSVSPRDDTMFQFLSLPLLNSLYLYREPHRPFHNALVAMLDRSECKLEELTLSCFYERTILRTLRKTPSLKSLTLLRPRDLPKQFFKQMKLDDQHSVAPNIESMDILCSSPAVWDDACIGEICDMVESRCKISASGGVSGLKRLSLRTNTVGGGLKACPATVDPTHPLHKRLLPLVAAGLSLVLVQ